MSAIARIDCGKDWLKNADQFLSGARVKITFWGSRSLRSDNDLGAISLKKIVSNIQTVAVRDCLHGPGLATNERLKGMEVSRRLRELYVVSNDLQKECSLFTRICLFVRDLLFGSGMRPVALSSMPAPQVGSYGPSYVERTFGCYTVSQYQTAFGRLAPVFLRERPRYLARIVLSESYLSGTINPLTKMADKGRAFFGRTRTLSIIGLGVLANYSLHYFNAVRVRGNALLTRARANPRFDVACERVGGAVQYARAQLVRGYHYAQARVA